MFGTKDQVLVPKVDIWYPQIDCWYQTLIFGTPEFIVGTKIDFCITESLLINIF